MKTLLHVSMVSGAVFFVSCKPTAAPEKKANVTTPTYTSPPYVDPNAATSSYQTYSIRLVGQASLTTTLQVTLNQPVVWQFEAVSSDGVTRGQITRLLVNGQAQHASMTISGNTINFTPRTQQDLIGTVEVTGTGPYSTTSSTSTPVSQTFAWSSSSLTNGGILDVGGSSVLKNILMNAGISVLTGKIDLKNLDANTLKQLLQSGGLSSILGPTASTIP